MRDEEEEEAKIQIMTTDNFYRNYLVLIAWQTCSAHTSVPSLFWTGKTSLHSWMPVVSGSEPPLQENPVSGSSSWPSQFISPCRDTN